jgi:hypothetical protein
VTNRTADRRAIQGGANFLALTRSQLDSDMTSKKLREILDKIQDLVYTVSI